MEPMVEQLEQVLATELELLEAMLGIHREKQREIVSLDGDGLLSCLERERRILAPLEALERERVRLMNAGLENDERLTLLRDRLRTTVTEIQAMSAMNHSLLDSSLEFMRVSLRMVTGNYTLQLVDRRG